MAASDGKIEGIREVQKTTSSGSTENIDKTNSAEDKFKNLMDSPSSSIQRSFERIEPKSVQAVSGDMTAMETKETATFGEENVTGQKLGSATDQEQKRQQHQGEDEEVEGISKVEGTGRKGAATTESTATSDASAGIGKISPEELSAQTKGISGKIETVKTQLIQANASGAEIKPSYQKLLRNHLSHVEDNLKIASSKVGVEYKPADPAAGNKSTNPLEKFLGLLTHSQQQIDSMGGAINAINSMGGKMTPGAMLAFQMKVNLIQQEIELFTNLLNKALESTKTIMNVQI